MRRPVNYRFARSDPGPVVHDRQVECQMPPAAEVPVQSRLLLRSWQSMARNANGRLLRWFGLVASGEERPGGTTSSISHGASCPSACGSGRMGPDQRVLATDLKLGPCTERSLPQSRGVIFHAAAVLTFIVPLGVFGTLVKASLRSLHTDWREPAFSRKHHVSALDRTLSEPNDLAPNRNHACP